MTANTLCNATGFGISGLFDNVFNYSSTQTRGVDSILSENKSSIYNQLLRVDEASTFTFTSVSSINKGTAYDLVSDDAYIGGIDMFNPGQIDVKTDISKIEKWYNRFIYSFIILSLLLIIIQQINDSFLPLEAVVVGVIIFIAGAIGMYIDKIRWKESK